jgi:hypothetical protein
LVLGWKEFNGTPQFCSLPQGEIKEYTLTLALSHWWGEGTFKRGERMRRLRD